MIPKYAIPRGEAVPGPSPQEAGARVGRQCEHPRERRVHRAHPAVGTLRGHSRVRAEPKELLSLPPGSVGIIRPSRSRCLHELTTITAIIITALAEVGRELINLSVRQAIRSQPAVEVSGGVEVPVLIRTTGGRSRVARLPNPVAYEKEEVHDDKRRPMMPPPQRQPSRQGAYAAAVR